MKPKPIMAKQETLIEQPPMYKKMSIETPIGTLESDSGNHMIDVITIVGVISVLYIGKKLVNKYIK